VVNRVNKRVALLLITMVAASSLMMGGSTFAQSIPKPSVPEFTVEYVDSSYYVPPVYGIDQYSGKTVQTGGGFTVQNKTIQVTIKNQPFTPYDNENGHTIRLRYRLSYKGHYAEYWNNYPRLGLEDKYINPSSSHTIVMFGLGIEGIDHYISDPHVDLDVLSPGDKVDFKVQATIGYYTIAEGYSSGPIGVYDTSHLIFHGELSDWSSTQTLTIGADSSKTSPGANNPTISNPSDSTTPETSSSSDQTTEPTPSHALEPAANDTSQTLQSEIIIGTVIAVVLVSVGLLVYFKRGRHQTKKS
jgi:hypothetical protein